MENWRNEDGLCVVVCALQKWPHPDSQGPILAIVNFNVIVLHLPPTPPPPILHAPESESSS